MTRPSGEIERNALKTAFKRLLVEVGGIDAAAACTRLARSHLDRCGNVQGADFAPIDVVLDLERIAGQPLVTQALAVAQGCMLMPVDLGPGDLAQTMQQVALDAGQTMADAMRFIANDLPESDRPQLQADLQNLLRHVQAALGKVSAGGGASRGCIVRSPE